MNNLPANLDKEVKKLKNPRISVMRWSKSQRYYINPRYRCVFDIESNPQHFKKSIEEKVKLANMRDGVEGEPGYQITEYEYRRFIILMQRHPNVMRARTIILLNCYQDEKLIEHIFIAEKKALKSDDPNKLLNLHKYIDKFFKNTLDMLTLTSAKKKKRKYNPRSIVDENGVVHLED